MKRLIAILVSLCITIAMLAGCTGRETGNQLATKGELLQMIASAFGMSYYDQKTPYINRIAEDNEYFDAVQIAVEWDIISVNDQKFKPEDSVTKDFLATSLVSAGRLTTSETLVFKDADSLSDTEKAVTAVMLGLVEPNTSNVFGPNIKMTLEECETALWLAHNIWANESYDSPKLEWIIKENVLDLSGIEQIHSSDEAQNGTLPSIDINTLPPIEENEILNGSVFEDAVFNFDDNTIQMTTEKAKELNEEMVFILPASSQVPYAIGYKVLDIEVVGDSSVVVHIRQAELGELYDEFRSCSTEILSSQNAIFTPADQTNSDEYSPLGFHTDYSNLDGLSVKTLSTNQLAIYDGFDKQFAKVDYGVNGNNWFFEITETLGDKSNGNGIVVEAKQRFDVNNIRFNQDINVKYKGILPSKLNAKVSVSYETVSTTSVGVDGSLSMIAAPYNNGNGKALNNIYRGFTTAMRPSGSKGAKSIKLGKFSLPFGGGSMKVDLLVELLITMEGKIELVIRNGYTSGIEVVNNKLRSISQNKELSRDLQIDAKLTALLSFNFGLSAFGCLIVDVGPQFGLGLDAHAKVHWVEDDGTASWLNFEMPSEIIADAAVSLGIEVECCCDVDLYPIITIVTGHRPRSVQGILGLSKTWTIVDKKNASIVQLHFEEGIIVDSCTRKAEEKEHKALEANKQPLNLNDYFVALDIGETYAINIIDLPRGYKKDQLVWSSTDTEIATVDNRGNVKAIQSGSVNITVTTKDGEYSAACSVMVRASFIPGTGGAGGGGGGHGFSNFNTAV